MNRRWIALALATLAPPACREARAPAASGGPAASPAAEAALPPGHPPLGAPASTAPADPAQAISGQVAVAPAVAGKVKSPAALFLIARSAESQQIVAVRKEDAAAFPFSFTISGADAMMGGGGPFSGLLDLTARVSSTGDAMPGPGDVEGVLKGVKVGTRDARITLDSVRP